VAVYCTVFVTSYREISIVKFIFFGGTLFEHHHEGLWPVGQITDNCWSSKEVGLIISSSEPILGVVDIEAEPHKKPFFCII